MKILFRKPLSARCYQVFAIDNKKLNTVTLLVLGKEARGTDLDRFLIIFDICRAVKTRPLIQGNMLRKLRYVFVLVKRQF